MVVADWCAGRHDLSVATRRFWMARQLERVEDAGAHEAGADQRLHEVREPESAEARDFYRDHRVSFALSRPIPVDILVRDGDGIPPVTAPSG